VLERQFKADPFGTKLHNGQNSGGFTNTFSFQAVLLAPFFELIKGFVFLGNLNAMISLFSGC